MSEAAHVFPSQLEIKPLLSPPKASVRVPGSKSMTNRALVLAALASRSGKCELLGVLRGEDTEIMVDALRALGFRLCPDWEANRIEMRQVTPDGVIPSHSADLFVGNSGTTMRFLTALVASGKGEFRLDGVSRMRERPIEDLLAALRQLGVRAESENGNGFPPVHIHSEGLKGGRVRIRGDISSQFLSGLLMAAPYASGGVTIGLEGPLVSGPYVDLTIAMMRRFGVEVDSRNTYFEVAPQRYQPRSYEIEPAASAASYFWAAAAITGGDIGVQGLDNASLQGDVRFIKILDEMGCHVRHGNKSVRVLGDKLRGITADMNDISDTVMSLAAAACFAEGPTT
ncbi:MAG: 3-phosphoshikimate 1-carboxyvinyltransferase, partial [Candidatus Acidiferrum sp.]